jgi:hypothetical protein
LASDIAKRAHELEVFREFVCASGLQIDAGSVEVREPPQPDIWCHDSSGALYFELGRLLDNEMQRLKIEVMRRAPKPVATSEFSPKLPERELLRRKISKAYETSGVPIHLLLYYDNTNWLVGDVPGSPMPFANHAKYVMQPIVDKQSQFQRVWVYERHRGTVLWSGAPSQNAV